MRHALPVVFVLAALPALAAGQAKLVPQGEVEGEKADDVKGWNPSLGVSGTLNLVSNSNVVGQIEGTSVLFGLGVTGGADYVNGRSVWRNRLSISESFARTPVVDRFIKNNDVVELESIYNYFLSKTLGVFARGAITTSATNTEAITADPVTYAILPSDPGGAVTMTTTDELRVADAFKPFTLTESIGAFAEPLSTELITLKIRAGFGGRHTLASGVLVQKDDAATAGVIELQRLANVQQAGAEIFAGANGKARGGRLGYQIGASALLPFINNDDFNRSATDLLRFALAAEASVAVFDWMAVTYKASLVVDPQLFPDGQELTQLQNSVLLTFQYTLLDRESTPAAPSELEAMTRAKDEAVEQAKAAEARAKALEEELKAVKAAPAPSNE